MTESSQLSMTLDIPESPNHPKTTPRKSRYKRFIKDGANDITPMTRDSAAKIVGDCKRILMNDGWLPDSSLLKLFARVIKIKRFDELTTSTGDAYAFQHSSNEPPAATATRLGILDDYMLDISDWTLASLAEALGPHSVAKSQTDILGIACEAFSNSFTKGSTGQFFTPREIVDFMLAIIKPRRGEKLLDPACGTGGILVAASKMLNPNDLHGMELNNAIAEVAGLNVDLHGGKAENVANINTLLDFTEGLYDVIVANPPFSVSIRDDYERFELSRRGKIKSEIAFIERIHSLLRPGGRAAMIVPDGLLSNITSKYVREWLMDQFRLDAVISLPADTFSHYGTSVKTSVLVLTKWNGDKDTFDDWAVFMAIVDSVGYDKRGKDTTTKTKMIQAGGTGATLIECGDLLHYINDADGSRVTDSGGLVGKWNEFLADPDRFVMN